MTRTSTRIVSLPPTRSKACSSRTRRTLACVLRLMSPISSRKSVPPSASSNLPRRRATAPVKAPRSWPKSSDSISSSGTAAQLTSTKGPSARVDRAWMARATSSLPEPLSPLAILLLEAGMLEGALHDEERLLERERLLDEVVGAELGRLDGGLDGAMAGDHHHGGLPPPLLDLGQRLEAVHAGHPDVEEDQIRRVVGQAPQRLLGGAHGRDPIALVLEDAP